jgi:hypothetical protein
MSNPKTAVVLKLEHADKNAGIIGELNEGESA